MPDAEQAHPLSLSLSLNLFLSLPHNPWAVGGSIGGMWALPATTQSIDSVTHSPTKSSADEK